MSNDWGNDNLGKLPKFDKDFGKVKRVKDYRQSSNWSFKPEIPRKPVADYGQFGDMYWEIKPLDPLTFDIKESEPREPPPLKLPTVPIYNDRPFLREREGESLSPIAFREEYEIYIKWDSGLFVTALSGFAHMARQQINQPIYDSSIVIISNTPISINNGSSSTVNLITLVGDLNPIYSLYNWVAERLGIVTAIDGVSVDGKLSKLRRRDDTPQLPSTTIDGGLNLFYGSGVNPVQICLAAVNLQFDYQTSNKSDLMPHSVTYTTDRLLLCADIQTIIRYRFIAILDNGGYSTGGNNKDPVELTVGYSGDFSLVLFKPSDSNWTEVDAADDYLKFNYYVTNAIDGNDLDFISIKPQEPPQSNTVQDVAMFGFSWIGGNIWISDIRDSNDNTFVNNPVDI